MKQIIGIASILYLLILASCCCSKCDRKDMICKSKEVIECLASDHYKSADKYFELDKNGTMLGHKKDFYLDQFKGLHDDLVKYGLPNDSSYKIEKEQWDTNHLFVSVILIDSTKKDSMWALEAVKFYFNDVKHSFTARIIGYHINGKITEKEAERSAKEFIEEAKKHPFPKDWTPPHN